MKGLIAQMMEDGRINEGGIGAGICEEKIRWDDISGEELNGAMVREARTEEMMEVDKHKVYVKVPVSECWEKTGKRQIKTRWIDINKGDKVNPEYRSRLVAKDLNDGKRWDLFAATPPLEALKALISMMMTKTIGWGVEGKEDMKMDFIDVRRAYFHADAVRDVNVELPEEEGEVKEVCGKLLKSMYGTRDAAQNWEKAYAEFMEEIECSTGIASPCVLIMKEEI